MRQFARVKPGDIFGETWQCTCPYCGGIINCNVNTNEIMECSKCKNMVRVYPFY